MANLDEALSCLPDLSRRELVERWTRVCDGPVPQVSAGLLRLALAWQLQAKAHGGLPRQTSQKLDQLAAGKSQTRSLMPGMRLTREYDGTLHIVSVEQDGTIRWNDQSWKSLSAVARAITSTRWSGPAFFGLKRSAKNISATAKKAA